MNTVVSCRPSLTAESSTLVSQRANALAKRLEDGARALAACVLVLTETQWRTPVLGDGRPIGVVVHHVASVYPLEIHLAQTLAAGEPVTGVTMADVHGMNAAHANAYQDVSKEAALQLLQQNSAAAATAIRALTDAELDRAATASLYSHAPVTCQFMLEDHAVRHSYHHLGRIQQTLIP